MTDDPTPNIDTPWLEGGKTGISRVWWRWLTAVIDGLWAASEALQTLVAAIPTLSSGTYTPTATLILNLDSATPYLASYTRVGNVVSVSGVITVDATAAAQCQLDLTIPVASAFTTITQLGGAGAIIGASSVYIVGEAANDRVRLYWVATSVGAINLSYSYQYQVI